MTRASLFSPSMALKPSRGPSKANACHNVSGFKRKYGIAVSRAFTFDKFWLKKLRFVCFDEKAK